ncbi:hybrid sensor histidine kinase/response regulator [Geminicoccus roseus]|uniref:hybrid sensor histidine kinase/response regulator n=1 Tax=Geminicoccus roseus TaxID=404900 RepID=UPI0004236ABB|nr:response regulator [Geminicoccus roseus]
MIAFDMEYREHVAAMRRLSTPAAGSAEIVEIFRRAHSLKGAARAVDHGAIEAVAHRLESLLELMQRRLVPPDADAVRVIQAALDTIEDVADDPGASLQGHAVLNSLDQLIEGASAANAAETPQEEPAPSPPPRLQSGALPEPCPAAPASAPAPPPDLPPSRPAPAPKLARPATGGTESLRVRAVHLDELMVTGGRLLAQVGEQADLGRQLRALQEDVVQLRRSWERNRLELRRQGAVPGAERNTPQVEALDKAISSIGRRLGQAVRSQSASTWKMRRLVDQLQEDVRQVRLVPAEEIFSGFGRMVRDLARQSGKQIEPRVTGLEIEADRMILQALKDPVMHVLRNAVAHGAELPEERAQAGKPPSTTITFQLSLDGTRLRLVVADDGRGIDFQRIRTTAVAAGLLDAGTADEVPEAELARLLLRSGFSTSPTVDELSGRGIGLSVLQETVTRLHGSVEIEPNQPYGTRLEVSLPVSVVRSDLLLVRCQEQVFAIPSHAIERVLRIRTDDISTLEGRAVLRTADRVASLVSLGMLLGLKDAVRTDGGGFCPVVVLHVGRRRLAVLVDALVEMRQAAIQEAPAGCDPVVAGTLLLEGRPIIVLSPAVLADGRSIATGPIFADAQAPRGPRRILVVDDSITTRTLEKSILEAEGFRVRLAVDGIDALDSLRREPADLVISDVQMPRLDGFGLLQALKSDPALASIPVIMVTSRDSPEEVQRGMELGADAYIVKQGFEQQALLETVAQFVEP